MEEELKKKKNPPHAPGWSGRSPYDTGNQPIGSGGSCTIIFSSRCGGGGAGEPGTCDDDPSNNEGDGSEGNPICTLGEIVVGGCTYSVTKVCQGGSGLTMLEHLEHLELVLADMGEEPACPATPAAGPSTPGERPAWIAEAAIAPSAGRRGPEGIEKRRNEGFRAIPAGSELHRATERP
ncbi:MAG: hypothetical protein OXG58_12025 [Gemmatimonadetes bacterium]|nr:hypothetical protein [Gemmatimonadota bacterium]